MKSLDQTVSRWKTGAGAAQTAFTQGVQDTQVDVAARAIAAQGAAVQGYTQALTSGRWARAITASGGTANWKARTLAKAANYSTGINANADKYQSAMSKLLPAFAQIVAGLPAKVPGDIGSSVARSSAFIQAAHGLKGTTKG